MTLTELRYVVAVARERSFGRAARACHVTQPTLSIAVKKLEESLGVLLFERGVHEVLPTPLGSRIVEQASRVIEDADLIRELAQQGGDPLAGELRVGAIYTVGPYLFPYLVAKLRRLAPRMPLVIEENFTARLLERLRNGELDAVILSLPVEMPGIVTWPVYSEPFSAIVPLGHPWIERRGVRPEDFAAENVLLLGPGHCFRDQVLDVCPQCRPSDTAIAGVKVMEGGSLETIRHMVASGYGVSVLPATSIAREARPRSSDELVVEVPFLGRSPSRTIAVAWRVTFPRTSAIEALRRAVLECALREITYLDFEKPAIAAAVGQ